MDIRNPNWFGQITFSGVATPINLSGSIHSMLSESLLHMRDSKPRQLNNGKEVVIRFAETPFTDKTFKSESETLRELESQVDWNSGHSEDGPHDDETWDQFFNRLVESGTPFQVAKYIANDWFKLPQDEQTERWMSDPMVAKFNELQVNRQAFENALPEEYAKLKNHIIKNYPERAAQITFRTA